MRELLTIASLFVLCAFQSNAQSVCGLGKYQHTGCEQGLQGIEEDQFTFIPPPVEFDPAEPPATRSSNIVVNYNGFPTNAQTAFQYAVEIWETVLSSNVNIVIDANWASIGGNTLGFAGANGFYINFGGATQSNTFYPQALANSLNGSDLAVGTADVSCTFNSGVNWYFGTDGNTPGGQFDFVTVVLHELGHGLGFLGSGDVSGGNGFVGFGSNPLIYDVFVENQGGTDITSFTSGTSALASQLQGDQLYWNGTEGVTNNSGNRPRLFAPNPYQGGSSYSHLREGTYPAGTPNSLMTPQLGTAEANHNPGPIVEGMFEDMGWVVGGCTIENVTINSVGECNPGTNTYNTSITIEYLAEPSGLLNINGGLYTLTGSPQTVSVNGLVSDGQPVDLNIFFTSEVDCNFSLSNAWTAPEACCGIIRLESANPDTKEVVLKNWGTCDANINDLRLCSEFQYATISGLAITDGSAIVPPNGTVTINWSVWTPSASGADLGLYVPSGGFNILDNMLDFTQWGSSGNGRENVAVAKGIWSSGDFVSGVAPYNYIGDGVQNGVAFWQGSTVPCSIAVSAGTQSVCDQFTGEFTQEVILTYAENPANGLISLNGNLYAITGSPQSIVLTLPADGSSTIATAFFTNDPTCTTTVNNLFTAPADCFCPADLDSSGDTDVIDLLIFLSDFGCMGNCLADLNNDGIVNGTDLLIFLANFGNDCP